MVWAYVCDPPRKLEPEVEEVRGEDIIEKMTEFLRGELKEEDRQWLLGVFENNLDDAVCIELYENFRDKHIPPGPSGPVPFKRFYKLLEENNLQGLGDE